MFGLQFLFAAALLALPVAGLPVILHLLFRRKSPIVPFSTLRFIRTSLQHTAARRKVQRWLLLACRMLALALLVWAVAQPAKMLASRWLAPGQSLLAAVVVDTSYSMELQGQTGMSVLPDQQVTLLSRADQMMGDLLRGPLKDAQVAVFRALPAPADHGEQFLSAAKIQSEWAPLKPQASPVPLVDRVAAAANLLKAQPSGQKWLIVLSDLQSKEFPRPLPEVPEARLIVLDLHPEEARSAGITKVLLAPEQPIPGTRSEAVVEVTGRGGDARAVTLHVSTLDGKALLTRPPLMASFDGGGRAQVRFPIDIPAERFLLMTASLQADDALSWDNTRTQLVEVPPRQVVTVLGDSVQSPAERFLRLALDPSEGKLPSWPIDLRRGMDLSGKEGAAVAMLTQWPDAARAAYLRQFARDGGVLLLCLQPGLEESWPTLSDAQRTAIADLLPSSPQAAPSRGGIYRGAAAPAQQSLLKGLLDDQSQLSTLAVRRFVPFSVADGSVSAILSIAPATPAPGARSHGLLFRRVVGSGLVYTLATLPDARHTNLATHPLFLPLMVSLCLRPAHLGDAQNAELGTPLVISGARYAGLSQVEIEGPQRDVYVLKPTSEGTPSRGRRFIFDRAVAPGVYTWRTPGERPTLAVTNVQLPASESELIYRPAQSIAPAGPDTIIVRSLPELESHMASISQPQPHWSGPLALVLFLLCLEMLMGSMSKLWKPISLRSLLPGLAGAGKG